MNKGIISGHPRVTVERRMAGPTVVYARHTEESAAFGRIVAVVACLIGLAFFGAALATAWQGGRITWPHPGVIALAIGIPVAGIVHTIIVARNRVGSPANGCKSGPGRLFSDAGRMFDSIRSAMSKWRSQFT